MNRDPLGSHGRLVYDSAPPSPPPVVCHPGGTAAYDMHRASMTVDAATAWCRNNSKCAGFCAQSAGACKSTDVLDLHFLDGWAIHRTGSNASWTSWSTDAEAPPPTQRVQVFAKPMSNGARAVAVLNRGDAAVDATVNLSTIALPGASSGQPPAKPWARAKVRDLWAHKDEGEFDASFTVKSLAPHATALLMMTAVDAVTAKTDDGLAGGDVVSLAPQPNCTKKLHLCYQGSQMNIAEVVRLDPLACKPPNATLRAENCSQQGYSDSVGFDPIFKKVSLWKKQGDVGANTAAEAEGGEAAPAPYVLDLQPAAPPAEQAYHNRSLSSWGGNVVKAADGTYHGFFAAMTEGCNLGAWTSNSEVIHTIADSPTGPFRFQDVALMPWHHNPQVLLHPDGTWLLYTIGTVGVPAAHNCRKGEESEARSRSRTLGPSTGEYVQCHHSRSPSGPWTFLNVSGDPANPGIFGGGQTSNNDHGTNPTPVVLENGTVVIGAHDNVGFYVQVAPSWRGPFRRVPGHLFVFEGNKSHAVINEKDYVFEDPFLWFDKAAQRWRVLVHQCKCSRSLCVFCEVSKTRLHRLSRRASTVPRRRGRGLANGRPVRRVGPPEPHHAGLHHARPRQRGRDGSLCEAGAAQAPSGREGGAGSALHRRLPRNAEG